MYNVNKWCEFRVICGLCGQTARNLHDPLEFLKVLCWGRCLKHAEYIGELSRFCLNFAQRTHNFACENLEANMYGYSVTLFKRKIWTFCRNASLSFPGEMDLGYGITFDIFTHVLHGSLFLNLLKDKEIQCDDLEGGYNVAHLQTKRTVMIGKKYTFLGILFIYNK